MKKFVIGLDLGGTKITAASSDLKGNIIYKYTVPTKSNEGEKSVLDRIIFLTDYVIKKSQLLLKDILCITIGSPGPLDVKKGIILNTPNLPFKNFNIVDPISRKFMIPVILDNDGNVAAIGEYRFGAGYGTKNMIFITISTGIGAGAILNGRIYRGNTGNALEIGHMTLDKNGPRCNCGNYGCAEALCSGTAIAKKAKKAIENKETTSLSKYEIITAKDVFKEAELGDVVSKRIIDNALNYLGIFISNILNCFDPEVVVLGGGVCNAGSIIFDRVNKIAYKRSFRAIYNNSKIVPAKCGTDAGVMGAVAMGIYYSKNQKI